MVAVQEDANLLEVYPFLAPLYSRWERGFHHLPPVVEWARAMWPTVPLTVVALYVIMIVVVSRCMKHRKALDLSTALNVWNLLVTVFSFLGTFRVLPSYLHVLATIPLRDTICGDPMPLFGKGTTGLWLMMFTFSKVLQLLDTLFILLRKGKLIFLHPFHHTTVLLYCWYAFAFPSNVGTHFVAMNFAEHALMYGYFFLSGIKAWPRWLPPSIITVAQIAQMLVGAVICVFTLRYLSDGGPCLVHPGYAYAGAAMYATYFFLFVEFFVQRFILRSYNRSSKVVSKEA